MKPPGHSTSSLAYDALGRVFAASAIMALPGIAGSWADARWGVGWLGMAGFILGPPAGLAYLLIVFRKPPPSARPDPPENTNRESPPHGD
ncbi:hypothetical protein KOR34_06310 [Posidoniimonas corsicana]|uniref:F0F1-ATPase subunit (ATPase_gene1) n=1 Tax=Posidoniimonas corsicana TaxID=1938618 RepID=A0A5C5VCR0_9BACT|nr:hypothetical protein [Posidoniimonas corsicana]TWT35737.1 hypothetical protein KOR34_06310 [Posidoniimonas corsicana]